MMNMRILLPVICLQLCGCMENHKTTAVATDRADSNVQVMEKSQTAKAIETANKENAGFRDVTGTEVTVTVPCFGVCDSSTLDMLPRPDEATHKDSVVIRLLNAGEVFLLQPGEKGVKELDTPDKTFVRFSVGEVWVWKSSVE